MINLIQKTTKNIPIQSNAYKYPQKTFNKVNTSNNKIQKYKNIKTYNKLQYLQKRTIDFLIGFSLAILTSPIMVYSLYKIKKESPGSIFFKQSRIGLNGKVFICYKFRSMHINSKFNPYTQKDDCRIFPYGRIMRRMRIDELPQLLNVLKGEMHLIGPRAEWDILVDDYEKVIPNYHDRHIVAPGITGLAQVMYHYGENVEDAKNKLNYDLEYITTWSLFSEIKVICKTVEVVLGKQGI